VQKIENSIYMIAKTLEFVQHARVSAQIRQSHLERAGSTDPLTIEIKEKALQFEKWLEKRLTQAVEEHPVYHWFSQVKGTGDIAIGKVLGRISIEKCPTISSLWRFAQGAPISENGMVRVEKPKFGEKLHYDAKLKTMMWRLGKCLIQARGKYYNFYRKEKDDLKMRYLGKGWKIIPAAALPRIDKKKHEPDNMISVGHIDNMAQRKMRKLFLAHLWLVWRQAVGLPLSQPYAMQQLEHSHYYDPWDFVDEKRTEKIATKNKKPIKKEQSHQDRVNQNKRASHDI